MATEIESRTVYELIFRRCWEARPFSHLDLMRALSRMLRRTGLPLYFTEGFNPKPKISYLSHPLSTGHTSECERLRFELDGDVPDSEAEAAVLKQLPPGLAAERLSRIPFEQRKSVQPARLEYYMFIRKSASNMTSFSGNEAVQALAPRELSEAEIADARLFADGTGTLDFFDEYFERGLAIEIPGGNDYRRPEKWIDAGGDCEPGRMHFHRKREKGGV